MSDIPPVKVTYAAKSFSLDPAKFSTELISAVDLKEAEGHCVADFFRRQEKYLLAAMGIPREIIEAQSLRERQLRAIMGDDFVEDNEHAPGALAYWRLIARGAS